MKLWKKVFIGLVLGTIFGIFYPQYAISLKPLGDIFMRLIKMIMAPLIFFTLVSGITSMHDSSSVNRVGIKSLLMYIGTTLFAVIIGLMIALIMKPGNNSAIRECINIGSGDFEHHKFDILDFIINIIPNNALGVFLGNNMMQVVFFAIFSGIIINSLGIVSDPIKDLVQASSKITLKMISKVIQLSPYAAFSMTAVTISQKGIAIMLGLSKLVYAVVIAMGIQYLVFGMMIFIFCGLSPLPFYKKSLDYQLIALATGSSKAALPHTMQVCREKLGISAKSTAFVLPIGASINMNGFAINLSLTTIFFAQILGVHLSFNDYLVIAFTSSLGSIGGAGIPGASLIMLPMVLSSVNIPYTECIELIIGVDRILDLLRAAINITGDATVTLLVDNSEKSFNRETYYTN